MKLLEAIFVFALMVSFFYLYNHFFTRDEPPKPTKIYFIDKEGIKHEI